MPKFPLIFATVLISAVNGAAEARTPEIAPYQPDPYTLHLWHLDEADVPFDDSGSQPTPIRGRHNGARSGQPSLPRLGSAVHFGGFANGRPGQSDLAGGILTASPLLAAGSYDNVETGFQYFGPNGAFTYEMVVKLDVLPEAWPAIALGLISMDGDDRDRIFNCRIERGGFLAFIPLPDCGATGGAIATLPTRGPHAICTHEWFHVAFIYDGNGGVANNLKLYWTRIAPGIRMANLIGSGTLSSDLNGHTGDLAFGNEARAFEGNAEAEPLPGSLDEIRISGVARHPTDFLFIPLEDRFGPDRVAAHPPIPPRSDRPKLNLARILVNAADTRPPNAAGGILELESGLHRLEFDFGFDPEQIDGAVKLRCQLEGIDERWQETDIGMSMICAVLDSDGTPLSQYRFQSIDRSSGWESSLEDSRMSARAEPIFVPPGASTLQLTLTSGSAENTGFLAIRNLSLAAPSPGSVSIWQAESFSGPGTATSPADVPAGWKRSGNDPAIARMIFPPDRPALGLVDGDQTRHGAWTTALRLTPSTSARTLILSWEETFNVIGSSLHRATYINVPPGHYTFRAVGLAGGDQSVGDSFSLPILIHPPFWKELWFWPLVATAGAALIAAFPISRHRQRSKRRLDQLRFQNALETDRIRIASDMHDDLGTRVTVINMSAALARRDMDRAPENARRHLAKLSESARELVVAMDDLVWAVDPSHDTLDELGSHLTRLAEEVFHDTPVRCRLDIPSRLPHLALGADFRHNVALAVKEAMHNALRHAGPCEVLLSMEIKDNDLIIVLKDSGVGFDPSSISRGHGLENLCRRLNQVGGRCETHSKSGAGTTVTFRCRLPERPA